jgi:hypothetical protein
MDETSLISVIDLKIFHIRLLKLTMRVNGILYIFAQCYECLLIRE